MDSIKLEEVTLANLNEGQLENEFQQRLGELSGVFADALSFEQSSDGIVTAKIKMEAVFSFSPDNNAISVGVRAELVQPKRRLSVHSIYKRGKQWLVGRDPKQEPLPLLRPVNGGGSNGNE